MWKALSDFYHLMREPLTKRTVTEIYSDVNDNFIQSEFFFFFSYLCMCLKQVLIRQLFTSKRE